MRKLRVDVVRQEADAALTLGLLGDGKSLCANDIALARWISMQQLGADVTSVIANGERCAVNMVSDRLRELCNGRLPRGAGSKIVELVRKRLQRLDAKRVARNIIGAGASLKYRSIDLAVQMQKRLYPIVRAAFFAADYRHAAGKWIGGENDLRLCVHELRTVAYPCLQREAVKVWHKNRKWSGTDCSTTVYLKWDWPRVVGASHALFTSRHTKGLKCLVLDRVPVMTDVGHPTPGVLVAVPGRGYAFGTRWIPEDGEFTHVSVEGT